MNFKTVTTILTFFALSNAAPAPHRRQVRADVVASCTTPGTVALTFDDGPSGFSAEIVDVLDRYGAKGTFFYNGNNYGCIYDEENVDRILNAFESGHQIASHTWSHMHLTHLPDEKLQFEISSVHDALTKITGAAPAFMRPPFGEYDDDVLIVAGSIGEAVALWDFDSSDSLGTSPADQRDHYAQLIEQHPNSILSLEHEVLQSTAEEVLPFIISSLQGAGYDLVTLAECVGEDAYLHVGMPSSRDDSWTCDL